MRPSQPAAAPFFIPTVLRVSLLALPQIWARVAPLVLYGIHKKDDESKSKQLAGPGKVGAGGVAPTALHAATASSAASFTTSASLPTSSSDGEPKAPESEDDSSYIRFLKWLNSVMWWVSGACVVVVFVDSVERVPFTGRFHVVLLTPEMELSTQRDTLKGIFEAHGMPAPDSSSEPIAASDGASSNGHTTDAPTDSAAADEAQAQRREEAAAKRTKPLATFDAKTRETAQRVFDSLIAAVDPQLLRDRPNVNFQLHFLDSNEWNACALTAGAVVLYSGMAI